MFQGETAITIDDKGRLAIPTSYRDLVAGACGNPAILAYANKLAPNDQPDLGYAIIFPGMTLVKILFVSIMPAFL